MKDLKSMINNLSDVTEMIETIKDVYENVPILRYNINGTNVASIDLSKMKRIHFVESEEVFIKEYMSNIVIKPDMDDEEVADIIFESVIKRVKEHIDESKNILLKNTKATIHQEFRNIGNKVIDICKGNNEILSDKVQKILKGENIEELQKEGYSTISDIFVIKVAEKIGQLYNTFKDIDSNMDEISRVIKNEYILEVIPLLIQIGVSRNSIDSILNIEELSPLTVNNLCAENFIGLTHEKFIKTYILENSIMYEIIRGTFHTHTIKSVAERLFGLENVKCVKEAYQTETIGGELYDRVRFKLYIHNADTEYISNKLVALSSYIDMYTDYYHIYASKRFKEKQ